MKLFETQLCMQHIIRSGHAKENFLLFEKSNGDHINFEDLIIGKNQKDKLARLNVYAHGFLLRLLDCLKSDLPALVNFFGEELFNKFARIYIQENPSTSFTLYDLSKSFYDFIQKSQPNYSDLDEEERISYELPLALIEFEQARSRALLIEGFERNCFSEEDRKKYIINPTLQLLNLKFPLVDFYHDLLNDRASDLPQYRQCYVAIYRLNYRLKYFYLSQQQYNFLRDLKSDISLTDKLDKEIDDIERVHFIEKLNLNILTY